MLSLALFFIVMQYYFLHRGLQRVDPFFGDTQQMYRRSSSLHDDYPARVLLEAEMRYANVLAWNGVQKLSSLVNIRSSGWHSSRQNRDNHYTLRGYNRQGWMVVTLEMKAGNVGEVFEYRHRAHRCSLTPRHIFRVREHVESVSLGKLGLGILYIGSYFRLGYGVAIEVPVKDLFVGYMVINIASPAPIFCRDFLTITIPL
ncbi:hypothetical protein IW262DRAFT_1486784 [Armillaria fumosa]|nr:hypothetical protein IW262DRAFT_1486784 [Armillaria fumosa]